MLCCEVGDVVCGAFGRVGGWAVGAVVCFVVGTAGTEMYALALRGALPVCPEEMQSGLHWYCPTQSHVH